jgi:predicted O-methyltransferase YrrM
VGGRVWKVLERASGDGVRLHAGGTVTWSLEKRVVDFLEANLHPGAKTAETGVGASTVAFALLGCEHAVFAPGLEEFGRVRDLCASLEISTSGLRYVEGFSEDTLPGASLGDLDLALIDGGHGFPVPFLDWAYFAKRLRIGGFVVIDDTQIWTGEVLRDFLKAERNWQVVAEFDKSAIFRKLGEPVLKDWGGQPYVVSRSKVPPDWPWLRNVISGLTAQLKKSTEAAATLETCDLHDEKAVQQAIDSLSEVLVQLKDLKRRAGAKGLKIPGIPSFVENSSLRVSILEPSPPWGGEEIRDCHIPGMITDEEKKYYKYLTRFYSGAGAVVELGPWLGASTHYLLEGLGRNPAFTGRKLFVFDDFVWRPSWMDQYVPAGERLERHANFESLFRKCAGEESLSRMDVRRQKICDYDGNEELDPLHWQGGPIEQLYVDCGRTFEVNNAWFSKLYGSFIPDRTLVVMQDWRLWREIPAKWYNQTDLFTDSKEGLLTQIHEVRDGGIATFLYRGNRD